VKIFVPDASVILKWVIGENEEGQDKALSLLNGWLAQEHDFMLPSLWVYEVGNVLGLKKPREANKILGLLLEYEFRERKITAELIQETYDLMKEHRGVTFYDAVYHAVALQEDGIMITADKAYFDKMKVKKSLVLI
jgi:predicted nucleic acid-binding protein